MIKEIEVVQYPDRVQVRCNFKTYQLMGDRSGSDLARMFRDMGCRKVVFGNIKTDQEQLEFDMERLCDFD